MLDLRWLLAAGTSANVCNGSLDIYEVHPGTRKSSWGCRGGEGAHFIRQQVVYFIPREGVESR